MQNPEMTIANQALAASADSVYAATTFEHLFDITGEKAGTDGALGEAETKPHSLTVLSGTGAAPIAPQEGLVNVISFFQRHYAVTLSAVLADGYRAPEHLTALALVCAREVASAMTVDFLHVDDETRFALIKQFTPNITSCSEEQHFWSVFTALLFAYFDEFSEPGWEPEPSAWTFDDGDYAMTVWRTLGNKVVCDLLVVMTPWDTNQDVWNHVAPAMRLAREEFGDRLAGIRVIPPLSAYLSRWYHPDGTWEPLYEGVPTFDDLDDLIDAALANGDAS